MKSLIEKNALKPYYYGLFTLAFIILGSQLFSRWYDKQHPTKFPTLTFSAAAPLKNDHDKTFLTEFNPNELSEKQWMDLGFSEKQVRTIMNYKKSRGGSFTSKEELAKCYAISTEKFEELEPYILLESPKASVNYSQKNFKSELKISNKFNPNTLTIKGWQNMGFSDKQAATILKYKNYLGGQFKSKEDLKRCFVISEQHYQQLEPFISLPNHLAENSNQPKTKLQPFDPNQLDKKGWQNLGFSEKQVQVILNYKEKILKGSFKTAEDIKKCHVINAEKYNELLPYLRITPQNSFVAPVPIKQETDFSKIDLNDITFKQLLEFGFEERAAGSYVGFRKKLGGFATKNQILDTYNLDPELANKLINTCPLNASKIQKYKLSEAPEEWLKNHPYFKYSADKIIFYRITYPDDRKIWRFLKLKPEYETRMRLYTINE